MSSLREDGQSLQCKALKTVLSKLFFLCSFTGIHPSLIRSGICAYSAQERNLQRLTEHAVGTLVGIPGLEYYSFPFNSNGNSDLTFFPYPARQPHPRP